MRRKDISSLNFRTETGCDRGDRTVILRTIERKPNSYF